MEEKTFDFSKVPASWQLCFNRDCPRCEGCLRFVAGRHVPADHEWGPAVYPSNVPDESYVDAMQSYASNEIAINWNASLVAFLCWLDALGEN